MPCQPYIEGAEVVHCSTGDQDILDHLHTTLRRKPKPPSVSLCGNKAACCCQNSSRPEDPCIICDSSATATSAQCVHTLSQIMGQQHSCLWLRAVCHRSQIVPDARYPHTGGRTRLARPSRGRALALAGMSNYAGDHQGVCLVQ